MLKVITTELEWRETILSMKHDWYHTWDYHQIAKSNHEGLPMLLVVGEKHSQICLPVLFRKIDDEWNDATSVYGYPGVISSNMESNDNFRLFLQEINQWALENNVVSIFSRLNTCIDGIYNELNILSENKGETVMIDLSLSSDDQRKNYRKNYRNLVNKLVREGFTCRWGNTQPELAEFISIYNETMDRLGAAKYYYFDQFYYESLMNSHDFDVRIYSCYHDGQKVCSGLFIFCGEIVQYHLSGTVSDYKNLAPTRLMIDTVRQDATSLGYKIFHLGGGTSDERDSLFNFKYGFSKKTIDFRVLKLITNIDKYAQLSNIDKSEIEKYTDGFFPLYRQN